MEEKYIDRIHHYPSEKGKSQPKVEKVSYVDSVKVKSEPKVELKDEKEFVFGRLSQSEGSMLKNKTKQIAGKKSVDSASLYRYNKEPEEK